MSNQAGSFDRISKENGTRDIWPIVRLSGFTVPVLIISYLFGVFPHFGLGWIWEHWQNWGYPNYHEWLNDHIIRAVLSVFCLFTAILLWIGLLAWLVPPRIRTFAIVRGLAYVSDPAVAAEVAREYSRNAGNDGPITLHDDLRLGWLDQGLLALGSRGSGKSQVITRVLKDLVLNPPDDPRERRIILWDYTGEYTRMLPTDEFILLAPWHIDGWEWDLSPDVTNLSQARQFASLMVRPPKSGESNPMWPNGARQVMTGLLHFMKMITTPITFSKLLYTYSKATDTELRAIAEAGNPEVLRTLGQLEKAGREAPALTVDFAPAGQHILVYFPPTLNASFKRDFPNSGWDKKNLAFAVPNTPDNLEAVGVWVEAQRPEATTDKGNFNKTGASFVSNLSAYFSPITDLAFAWSNIDDERRRFSISEFLSDDWDGPELLVIQGSSEHKELSQALGATVLGMTIRKMNGPNFPMVQDRDHPYACYFALDELRALGNVPEIPDVQSEGRKNGMIPIVGLQNVSQVREVFGNNVADTITSQFGVFYIGTIGLGDTANWVSKDMLGSQDIIYLGDGVSGGQVNVSTQQRTQPVVTPSQFGSDLGTVGWGKPTSFRGLVYVGKTQEVLRLEWPIVPYRARRPSVIPNPSLDHTDFSQLFTEQDGAALASIRESIEAAAAT